MQQFYQHLTGRRYSRNRSVAYHEVVECPSIGVKPIRAYTTNQSSELSRRLSPHLQCRCKVYNTCARPVFTRSPCPHPWSCVPSHHLTPHYAEFQRKYGRTSRNKTSKTIGNQNSQLVTHVNTAYGLSSLSRRGTVLSHRTEQGGPKGNKTMLFSSAFYSTQKRDRRAPNGVHRRRPCALIGLFILSRSLSGGFFLYPSFPFS